MLVAIILPGMGNTPHIVHNKMVLNRSGNVIMIGCKADTNTLCCFIIDVIMIMLINTTTYCRDVIYSMKCMFSISCLYV